MIWTHPFSGLGLESNAEIHELGPVNQKTPIWSEVIEM